MNINDDTDNVGLAIQDEGYELDPPLVQQGGVWNSVPMKIVRWILFLPIGWVLWLILYALPILAVSITASWKPEFSFLILLIGLIVISFVGAFLGLWLFALSFTPVLACRIIAPNNKIASVIYGTIFVPYAVATFIMMINNGTPWIILGYFLFASVVFFYGIITAHAFERLND